LYKLVSLFIVYTSVFDWKSGYKNIYRLVQKWVATYYCYHFHSVPFFRRSWKVMIVLIFILVFCLKGIMVFPG